MTVSTRIYASGAIAFGGQPAINDLLAAGYDTVIVWSVHVSANGTLFLNDTQIVSGGVYREAVPMNLAPRIAQLRKAGTKIIFSVGAGGTSDFTNIETLMGGKPAQPGNPLYDNFKALKQAMVSAGGDIDAIDFDNEDNMKAIVMVNFAITLSNIGYSSVTFCPWDDEAIWYTTMKGVVAAKGPNFVSAIHLQVYSGGARNINRVSNWKSGFQQAGGKALMIPGLATNQSSDGPWWYNNAPGASINTVPNTAMSGSATWNNYLYTQNFPTVNDAFKGAQTAASFFFYCRVPLVLAGRSFNQGDAVFFTGIPTWAPASQADSYYLGAPCTNIYNPLPGACPKDLQTQYQKWKGVADGGFLWMYDSVISCLLAGCCGGLMNAPTTTALAYRQSISNGLQ